MIWGDGRESGLTIDSPPSALRLAIGDFRAIFDCSTTCGGLKIAESFCRLARANENWLMREGRPSE